MTPPRTKGLDEATVVSAAARIADAEGLEAATLSRIASELGVRPPPCTASSASSSVVASACPSTSTNPSKSSSTPSSSRSKLRR
jgi:hypothetical protein